MRVVLVLTQATGGPARVAAELATAVPDQADGLEMIVLGPPALSNAGLPPGMLRPITVHSKLDAGGFAAVRTELAALAPDVVHAQDHRAGLVCALVADGGIPTVMTYHGVPDSAAGRWVKEGPWSTQPLSLPGRSRLLAQRFVGRRLTCVVAPSAAMADFLVRELRLSAGRVRTIHNGVNVPPVVWPPGPVRRFITVSSFAPCKAVPQLVDTFLGIAEDRPDLSLRLVGDGPDRRRCEERAAHVGARVVEFAGYRSDVPEQMASGDAFVLPSLNENMPMALLEAMAAGLPCICSDVGGVSEILDDECGLLVRPGDAGSLRTAVEKLIADPDLAARLGAAARRRVQESFTVQRCAREHVQLWRQLAGSR
jgi:glycosyltransferase involved in cell wall biosynthesis